MNSILNLNTTWTVASFLNNIKHSFFDTIAGWYDSLSENSKNTLRMMETPAAMVKT